MFLKVDEKNQLQKDKFNQLWIECWEEKGYELEFSAQADRFIILNEKGEAIGTTEFINYIEGRNNCEEIYPFYELEQLKYHTNKVVEIDKICILKAQRGRNIKRIIYTIYHYTKNNNIQFCIGLMEPIFFKAMKLFYKFPITGLSKKVFYKGDWVIPVILDCDYVHKNIHKFKWLDELDKYLIDMEIY